MCNFGDREFPKNFESFNCNFSDYAEFSLPALYYRTVECKCNLCNKIQNSESHDYNDFDYHTSYYESIDDLNEKANLREKFIEDHENYIFPHLKGNLFLKEEIEDYKKNGVIPEILCIPNTMIKKLLLKFHGNAENNNDSKKDDIELVCDDIVI